MALLLAKVLIAPALLAACTLAARQWGEGVGGWLLGLPIVSGPVSMLLFLQYGPGFARHAARGTLLGLVATAAFCAAYARLAEKPVSWRTALIGAYAASLAAISLLASVDVGLVASIALVCAALAAMVVLAGLPAPELVAATPTPDHAEEPAALAPRMAIVGGTVLALTGAATALGATLAGMLSPIPVTAAVMAASAHRSGSRSAARGLLRGAVAGTWGGAAFFSVVGVAMGPLGPVATYGIATGAALVGSGVALRVRDVVNRRIH